MAKPYKLMPIKDTNKTKYNVRDRETNQIVGRLEQAGAKWNLQLFGEHKVLKDKKKAFGLIRGVYAARDMVTEVFTA